MAWGIFDFSDNTWMMLDFGRRGWTRDATKATPHASERDARTELDTFASAVHTPRIRPRELPANARIF